MPIEITSLTDLPQATVDDLTSKFTQMVREDNPNIEVRRGVIQTLVLHYMAVISAGNQESFDRYRKSSSLLEVNKDPTLADDSVVDAILSNFGITRRLGAVATGVVTIVVDRLATVTVPGDLIFAAEGVEFQSVASYVARTSSDNVQLETDRVLSPTADGNYTFDIDVIAVEEGANGLLKQNTQLIPAETINNYIASYAAYDFIGGVDTETNVEILARMQEGIACQSLSNRLNMRSLLRSLDGFEDVLHSSIIGFGDAEMLRDRSGLFPISCGGKVDWYVRTVEEPQRVELIKTATLISKQTDNRGIWQVTISRDDAPGFYDIFQIKPSDSYNYTGSYTVVRELRDVDTTDIAGVLTPHIPSAMHGYFSRYQTSSIQFKDTDTAVSGLTLGDTADYRVVVRIMPGMSELQASLGSLQHRNFGGDVLIKAPVPAMVSLSFNVLIPIGDPVPDVVAMRKSIATYINTRGFSGKLYASAITDIAHNYLGSRTNLSAIDMYAQIFSPDKEVRVLRATDVLRIPNLPESLVTPNTCVFVCDPMNVNISGEGLPRPDDF